jgi:hypothetical protein
LNGVTTGTATGAGASVGPGVERQVVRASSLDLVSQRVERGLRIAGRQRRGELLHRVGKRCECSSRTGRTTLNREALQEVVVGTRRVDTSETADLCRRETGREQRRDRSGVGGRRNTGETLHCGECRVVLRARDDSGRDQLLNELVLIGRIRGQ